MTPYKPFKTMYRICFPSLEGGSALVTHRYMAKAEVQECLRKDRLAYPDAAPAKVIECYVEV